MRWLASGGRGRESGSDETVHSSCWWRTVTDYEGGGRREEGDRIIAECVSTSQYHDY